MKLSEFVNGENEKKEAKAKEKLESKTSNANEEELTKLYNDMKDMSEDDLMKRLADNIKEQKKRGDFDYDGLLNTLYSFKGLIPEENFDRMIRIIDELQKDWPKTISTNLLFNKR